MYGTGPFADAAEASTGAGKGRQTAYAVSHAQGTGTQFTCFTGTKLQILTQLRQPKPSEELSPSVPKMTTVEIPQSAIGKIIG
jgi:hypothetical protein